MESSIELFLSQYRYLAIIIGIFFEGELILILASILATQGEMRFEWVIIAAAFGAFSADLCAYFVGTWKVDYLLQRIPTMRKYLPRAQNFFRRFGIVSILMTKFFYGLRLPTGVFCGMTRIGIFRFLIVSLIGCSLWAILWGVMAYFFGRSISFIVEDVQKYQNIIFIFFRSRVSFCNILCICLLRL